jgi:glycosyltransferase involved in cell wall biosynthesis
MRVLALPRYGRAAASTRQRFIQYEPQLAAAGISVDYSPLLDDAHLQRILRGQRRSVTMAAASYLERLARLAGGRRYDALWIHCELFPYLPGLFERIGPMLGRPILYDFDDAIFHNYDENRSPLIQKLLARKLEPLLRRAQACACGNLYLWNYAKRFCENSIILPTVVDTEIYVPRREEEPNGPPVIGWIGSPSTWTNVRPLLPVLREIAGNGQARVRAIGAGTQAEGDRFYGLELVEWTEATEVAEVQNMDIGIMPLLDLPFQRGKSGYKLIQYMACGLPTIASPIGVNSEIMIEGETGFLATSADEWRASLRQLIDDAELRRRMGAAGRRRAEAEYSLATQGPRLVSLMQSLGRTNAARP